MTARPEPADDQWVGSVVRSGIDRRVWVAVVPDTDTWSGAMQASTSRRRCQAHVEDHVRRWGDSDATVRWERDDDLDWVAYLAEPDVSTER